MQAKQAFCVNILHPDEKENAFFYGVGKEVLAGEPPVGNKYGGTTIFVPIGKVADSAEFILFHTWLKHAIQISFAEEIVQGNGVQRVETPKGLTARRVERI